MEGWILWLLAGVLLAVGEILTLSFFLFPFAIGAFGAAAAGALGASTSTSILAFVVLTALSLGVVRPIARRHLRTPPQLRTGTAALVGRSATVLEDVTPTAGTVRLDGEVWTARPYDEDATIPAGTRVEVLEIRGATALVSQ